MDFEHDVPEWTAEGTEPPASLKSGGFQAGYKPPAAYFNWFWSGVSACLTEIRTKLGTHKHAASDITSGTLGVARGGTGKSTITAGNYVVGNGTGAMTEKTPAQVLADIGAASADAVEPIITTTGTSTAYLATVPGITALTEGVSFIMVPHVVSSTISPSLDVNGLGAKGIRMGLSFNTGAITTAQLPTFLSEGKPVRMMYDGNYWKPSIYRTSAQDLYGSVPVASGGTGADNAAEARDNLGAAAKAVAVAVTVTAAGWSGGVQTVSVAGMTVDTHFAYSLAITATADQRAASRDALIAATGKATGTVTLTCDGDVPTTDLPFEFTLLG